jgi:hypothetical protein
METAPPKLKPGELFVKGVGVITIGRDGRGVVKKSKGAVGSSSPRQAPDYLTPLSIQCGGLKLPGPGSELQFHPPRRWRFDFVWWFCELNTRRELKIALEVEGGTWMAEGGHNHPGDFLRDMDKYNQAELDGWMLLRVTPDMIEFENGRAVLLVEKALNGSLR